MDEALLKSLLSQPEGVALDFKRDQYSFVGAADHKKSELLKDIISFVNTTRKETAYILIGIQEELDGNASIYGVDGHLSDADLQQFINSKLNHPIIFSYIPCNIYDKKVGVIKIPVQKRPVYLLKNYVGLKKHEVLHRRGSSTSIATPEEVAEMGVIDSKLKVFANPVLGLSNSGDERTASDHLSIESTIFPNIDKDSVGIYQENGSDNRQAFAAFNLSMERDNPDYFKEVEEYARLLALAQPVYFSVKNIGEGIARNIKAKIRIPYNDQLVIMEADELPTKPEKTVLVGYNPDISSMFRDFHKFESWQINHNSRDKYWELTILCDYVHARDITFFVYPIYIGSVTPQRLKLQVKLFSDELVTPNVQELHIDIQVMENYATLLDLCDLVDQ